MHGRQTIREAVAAILATGASNWASVMQTRIVTSRQVWPFLMVYSSEEQSEQVLIHQNGIYDRKASIRIEGMLKVPGTGDGSGNMENVEDIMDAMAAEIETKLTNTTIKTLVQKLQSIELQSTTMEIILADDDASISHAVVTQIWGISYATSEGAPEVLI